MKKLFVVLTACLFVLGGCTKWTPLFNGKDLTGWHQASGPAGYSVEKGCIVGTIKANQPGGNSFLVTDASYSDFILEFEYLLEAGNSGVQFRSHQRENGRVFGYQFEFDNNPNRAWTGGIYDEARTGWLYPLTFNQEARTAPKYGEWNKGRIEAIGGHIRTFVNGIECANLLDNQDSEGFIGLQVHATKDAALDGKTVRWRKIRILTEDLDKYVTPANDAIHQVNSVPNTLSGKQQAEGWKLLFDGKTSNGWRSAKAETFPEEGWTVGDGMLQVWENGGAESTHGGDIITVDQYENFWLSVDFKITKGANSGIKYFVRPDLYNVIEASAIGCEFQILDDANHPDAKLGTAGNRTLGSLYDLIKSDKDDAWFRNGQWNTAWVKVEGNHVEHWLNGVKIVEYERNNQVFNALVACSKYKDWENFGNHKKGHILLQEHGNQVFYRNVMIKELPSTPEVKEETPVLPADLLSGMVDLWDGKTSAGWTSVKGEKFPEHGWAMEDGVLIANKPGDKRGGDIMTEKAYKNFILSVDYKLTEGANGGIKYFVNPGTYKDPSIGCECQVLDDFVHRDAKLGTAGNRTAGSLYDLIKADKDPEQFKPYEWNTAVVIVRDNYVEHWLNGKRVVAYTRNNQAFNALVKYSKFRDKEGFGNFETGHILLQDHVDCVYYKNIKIKEL